MGCGLVGLVLVSVGGCQRMRPWLGCPQPIQGKGTRAKNQEAGDSATKASDNMMTLMLTVVLEVEEVDAGHPGCHPSVMEPQIVVPNSKISEPDLEAPCGEERGGGGG